MSRVAVLGASTLAGREVVERLRAAGLDRAGLALVEPGSDSAVVSAVRDELMVSTPRTREALAGADVVLACAALPEDDAAAVREAAASAAVIDLTGRLGGRPFDARSLREPLGPGLHAAAAAASLLVAALVRSARAAGATGPVAAVVLEPASEIGQEAVDELFGQAVATLNFTPLPREVFGRQAVHDVQSPGRDGEAREALLRGEVEALAGEPAPALLLARPGVFHGVAAAVHAAVDAARWREAVAREPRLALSDDAASASPVAAVQAELAVVGRIVADGAGGAWAWAAADSIVHGAVGNAVEAVALARRRDQHAH